MTVAITIEIPDSLSEQLRSVQDRLPEILERGLYEVLAESESAGEDERAIIAVLASQPTPEEVLKIRPSEAFQARIDLLTARVKSDSLSDDDRAELDRYELLEHLVRMAKGYALLQLKRGS